MQTKLVPYTFVRSGYFYYTRRVPKDLADDYSSTRIVKSLRTKCFRRAKLQANQTSANLEKYWSHLRLTASEVPEMSKMSIVEMIKDAKQRNKTAQDIPDLKQALAIYLELKGRGRPKSFEAAATRTYGYVVQIAGNKLLDQYTRSDALRFRDWLVKKGLTGSSVTRNLSYIKAIFNFASSEYALDLTNPFSGVYHDRAAGVTKRKPIVLSELHQVQLECRIIDDDLRWLIALISDTGMRLAEGAGLLKEDLFLNAEIPYVRIQKHPWRNLKTAASQRDVPLVGSSLWAAQRLLEAGNNSMYAFPRYNRTDVTAANSASAALNKWLRNYVTKGCTVHSFRHAMRDRLRAIQCPADIADQIGGWATDGVGQGYGSGYPLDVLHKWMAKLVYENGPQSLQK